MLPYQRGIIEDIPLQARYMNFKLADSSYLTEALWSLTQIVDGRSAVLGLSHNIVRRFTDIEGLKKAPEIDTNEVYVPSSDFDLWIWLRDDDRGKIFHTSRTIAKALRPAFQLISVDDGCQYIDNRVLSGFKDGTENPKGDDAIDATIVQDKVKGLYGSSFVAVQKWKTNFDWLDGQSLQHKESLVGRSLEDDHQFENNKPFAHVKRTDQESFDPEAFVVRRSMPWIEGMEGGLMFVSFSKNLSAFEVQLNRMCGLDDGIIDGIFQFTKPVTSAYFWCPPFRTGKLDLSAVGI